MKKNLLSVLLALVLVLGLTVFAAPAVSAEEEATAHTHHCYCVNAEYVPEDHVCEASAEWTELTSSTTVVDGGHYYLNSATVNSGVFKALTNSSAKKNVVICLNGNVLRAQQIIKVQNGNKVTICDCQGGGQIRSSQQNGTGFAVHAGYNGGVVNLYSGTISGYIVSGVYGRPVIVNGGTFNMYGGSIINGNSGTLTTDGIASVGYGGNVLVNNFVGSKTHEGTFNMYGGEIKNGSASADGGNIYVESGTLVISGGTITGGSAVNGGNIASTGINDNAAALTISGTVQNGTATGNGGNIYLFISTNGTVFTLNDTGVISGGKAVNGGNIAQAGASTINTAGGLISDGEASGNGGNIYTYSSTKTDGTASDATFRLQGATVSGGTAGKTVETVTDPETNETTETVTYTGDGGNIFVSNGSKLVVNSGTVSGGQAHFGGNIYGEGASATNRSTITLNDGIVTQGQASSGGNIYTTGELKIVGGTVSDGISNGTAGNIRVNGTVSQLTMTGGVVSGGKAADNGGNFYIYNCTNAAITGGQILNGESEGNQGGGNIYATHNKLTSTRSLALKNVTVSGGKATKGNGGNLYIRQVGKVTIKDVTLENGSAVSGDNLYLQNNLTVDITGGTFTATYGGRRFPTNSSSYTEEQLALITQYGFNNPGGDAEETGNGGNICIYSCGDLTETIESTDETTGETTTTTTVTAAGYVNINGTTILGGNAENGGAIYVGNGTVTLDGVTAKTCGGSSGKVLNISKNGTATVKDSTLVNWGIQGTAIVNNGNLILQGNINMPKEYNASEMMGTLSITQEILIKCNDNANAVMDITGLTSVDADVDNVENVIHGDGVLLVGRSENTNSDGDVLNTAGLVANGVNDTNRALVIAYNAAFVLRETDGSFYLDNALIQGVTENGNLTGGGANFDDMTNDGKTSVVYYILNGNLENAGIIGKDIYLNLNGHTVTGATVAEGVTLNLMDTANDGYDSTKCGSFAGTVNGTLESIVHVNISSGSRHYVILPNEDGSYSAHRYLAYISHNSLKPDEAALGFKATFRGDEYVRKVTTGYGFNMWVNNCAAKEFFKESPDWTTEGTTLSLRVKNMLVEGGDAISKIGASATVNGEAFIRFNINGQDVYATTSPKGVTLKSFIKSLNTDLAANPGNYNATQITAVQAMINKFSAYMEGWEYDAIMAWSEATEEPVPETTEAA